MASEYGMRGIQTRRIENAETKIEEVEFSAFGVF